MNIKKLLIGTIAGGIVFFLLGWLIYGNLLADFMRHHAGEKPHLDRKNILFLYLVIGNLVQALLLTYIILKSGSRGLANGFITGLTVGLLASVGFDTVIYATSLILSKKSMLADVLAYTVMSGIAGAVIGALAGNKKE